MRNFKWRLFLRKRNCGNSSHSILCETVELQITDCSVCESRTAELRGIVYSLCGSETAELQVIEYSLCGGGTVGLKVKLLYGSETTKLQVVLNLLYGSGTAQLPSHSIFLVRKRNCAISELQVTHYTVAEAELRNFKSQYIPCAQAELQAKEYSMCGTGTAEHQVL